MSDSGGKRPALVWAILVLYTFGVVITLASMYVLLSGAPHLAATDAAFYAGFGTVIVAFLIVCYTWHLKRTGALR